MPCVTMKMLVDESLFPDCVYACMAHRLLGDDCPPLLVIGPRPLLFSLQAWSRMEHLKYFFVDCRETAEGGMAARAGRYQGAVGMLRTC